MPPAVRSFFPYKPRPLYLPFKSTSLHIHPFSAAVVAQNIDKKQFDKGGVMGTVNYSKPPNTVLVLLRHWFKISLNRQGTRGSSSVSLIIIKSSSFVLRLNAAIVLLLSLWVTSVVYDKNTHVDQVITFGMQLIVVRVFPEKSIGSNYSSGTRGTVGRESESQEDRVKV